MPSITVKNIPEPIYQQLRKRAQAQHRSINSEIIACLEQTTLPHRPSPEEFLLQARKMRQQVKGRLSAQLIQKAIDQGRP